MSVQIIHGDCRIALKELADQSVHCCVTSPPYFGLRDYKVDGQIGLEDTLDEYLAKITTVFSEVRRVLRDDGSLWINLGDSYASAWACSRRNVIGSGSLTNGKREARPNRLVNGLKEKDLIGMPWRVAFALQAAGWYLRRDIIWSKPNPMPESAQDRPTTAHEYIFLMTKRPHYFYDHEAIKEPVTGTAHPRGDGVNPKSTGYAAPTGWDTDAGSHGTIHKNGRREGANSRLRKSMDPDHLRDEGVKSNRSYSAAVSGLVSSRNKRSVWTVASAPFKSAHFATYPPDLIKPCILAGAPIHCCVKCGAPHERQVVNGEPDREHQRACGADLNGEYHGTATKDFAAHGAQDASAVKARILAGMTAKITTGFKPTCDCNAGRQPGIVLDPFGGSGTTGAVALELGRRAILIELNPDYVTLCQTRCQTTQGLPLG